MPLACRSILFFFFLKRPFDFGVRLLSVKTEPLGFGLATGLSLGHDQAL